MRKLIISVVLLIVILLGFFLKDNKKINIRRNLVSREEKPILQIAEPVNYIGDNIEKIKSCVTPICCSENKSLYMSQISAPISIKIINDQKIYSNISSAIEKYNIPNLTFYNPISVAVKDIFDNHTFFTVNPIQVAITSTSEIAFYEISPLLLTTNSSGYSIVINPIIFSENVLPTNIEEFNQLIVNNNLIQFNFNELISINDVSPELLVKIIEFYKLQIKSAVPIKINLFWGLRKVSPDSPLGKMQEEINKVYESGDMELFSKLINNYVDLINSYEIREELFKNK